MQEVHTLYKLIVLYMLNKVDFPLTNSQISVFVIDEQYMDYFTLQETLSDMVEAKLVTPETIHNSTRYSLTEMGRETLAFFGHEISEAIREDIHRYLRENKVKMRDENAVTADYFNNEDGEYTVKMQIQEQHKNLLSIEINVPLEQQAIFACDNWRKNHVEMYEYLMKELMKK